MSRARTLARGVLDFLRDAWVVVLFRPVRYGTLDLREHPSGIAGIAWAVSALYALTVVSIVVANPLRSISPLQTSINDTSFLAVPTFLLPAVLCLLGVAFGLLLAGSQRAPWWRRILYLVVVGGALVSVMGICVSVGSSRSLAIASVVILLLILLYCLVMWTGRTAATWDAFALVLLASALLLVTYRSLITQGLAGQTAGELITVSLVLTQVATLAIPLAFLSGVNAASLGVSLIAWSGEEVGRRSSTRVGVVVVVIALAWQWVSVFTGTSRGPDEWLIEGREIASAAVLLGACWLAWVACHRRSGPEGRSPVDVAASSVRVAVPVAYGITAAAFLSALVGALITSLNSVLPPDALTPMLGLLDLVGSVAFTQALRIAVIGGLVLASVLLVRRGSALLASVAAIDAIVLATYFWIGYLLPDWGWTPSAIGDVGLIAGTVLAIAWTARRSWSRSRAAILILVVLLSALVRQADFFTVPLGFLIGASAAALLVVGLVWGYLTDGGEVHEDLPRFPRDRRLLVLLGSALFAIVIVAWAVIGKDVGTSMVLADAGVQAVWTLGSALIIAVVLEAATAPAPAADH